MHSTFGLQPHVFSLLKRKARESNPHLPCGRAALAVRSGQPYPATFHMSVDSPGVEPESPPCHSGVVPLDHEPEVTEVGVEPTKSPGSRPGRFSCLRTRPSVASPGVAPGVRSL